jgi:hypothetical protein
VVTDAVIIDRCRKWVSTVVVGLNFCPFAKPVIEANAVRYTVVNDRSVEACLVALSDEMQRLQADDGIETTLIICPVGFEAFEDYLDLLAVADALLVDEGFEGTFQLASFHHDYCFDGAVYEDPANYTNRSPFPMLHLLREASIEKALVNVAHPEKIPNRNIEVARALGIKKMRMLAAPEEQEAD